MRKIVVFCLCILSFSCFAKFPSKPIKLIVYTKPGGAIDVFARKFKAVASKYTKANIVIVNKTGAGGLIASKYVLKKKSDYIISAITKSVIGKLVISKNAKKIDEFHYLGLLASDPEAVIVNSDSKINSWESLIKDAKVKNGDQVWVGPAVGGNDHIMALKLWELVGVKAKWIPYAGGAKAMTALMGKHGVAYVGNPGDVIGKKNLKVVAISSPKRLPGKFSNIPTFNELGVKKFDGEIMWRGFATHGKISSEAKLFYNDLLKKVSTDLGWKKYIEENGASAVFLENNEFQKVVTQDKNDFIKIGKKLELIK